MNEVGQFSRARGSSLDHSYPKKTQFLLSPGDGYYTPDFDNFLISF
jgi:hypothetical protein